VRSRSVADAACRKRMPAPLAGPCRTRGSDRVRTASRDAQCVRQAPASSCRLREHPAGSISPAVSGAVAAGSAP
jgi:hypothetical protein